MPVSHGGVECLIHGFFHFKDAGWSADELTHRWTWLCPIEGCGEVLGWDFYYPAPDTPYRLEEARTPI